MQKLNNFIYMIAAAIVSNLVYAINGISAYADTCTFRHNFYATERYLANNPSECTSICSLYWAGAESWHASYTPTIRTCTCFVMYEATTTGTWQTVAGGACGQRVECAATYRPCDTCTNETGVRASGTICNSDNKPGYAGYLTETCNSESCYDVCECCPCTGTAGMGEDCMGSQNSAGPYMLVYSNPYAASLKGCYIQGTGGLDNTGTFEYTQESACYFR